jgi:tRNA-dihydrouridine synthase B
MADAAQVVEGMGADIVDINMGCPVPKIAKHHAGCSLMREPEHAASVVRAMARAVKIPVTVKMRAGWNDQEINAPLLARLVEDAGASALAVHGRTAAQSYTGDSDWSLIERVAASVKIPVFGSGDCVSAEQVVTRLQGGQVRGVLIGRGALRNPWIFQQASLAGMGVTPASVPLQMRGQFLLDYINLLLAERVDEREGFRHSAPGEADADRPQPARGRERWVVNKLRALGSWYTKGLDGGSRLRTAINSADSIPTLRQIIADFFFEVPQGVS